MNGKNIPSLIIKVAPFTGAWIEIVPFVLQWYIIIVAPFTGAWIEIRLKVRKLLKKLTSRSLHGGVD